jgi:hypothetical protein
MIMLLSFALAGCTPLPVEAAAKEEDGNKSRNAFTGYLSK